MIQNKGWCVLLFCGILLWSCQPSYKLIPDESYVAFSLREAQNLVRNKNSSVDSNVFSLGGITRLAGMVIDRRNKDIILIGEKTSQLPPARFDDFVTALRARIIYDELPMVSIDPIPNSSESGMQVVRFGGHIEQTSFGYDCLESDIFLKKYSLELEQQLNDISSYSKLLLEDAVEKLRQKGIYTKEMKWVNPDSLRLFRGRGLDYEENSQSRFWFNYKNPCVVRIRGDVFCIFALDIVIEKEVTIDGIKQNRNITPSGKILPDEKFAELFTANFYRISDTYPILKRLKILFDMTAVAEGLKNTKDIPDISFLLKEYQVKAVDTRKEFALIKKCAVIQRSDRKINLVQLSGGIETSVEMQWLNGGDVSYLAKAVLESRPGTNSLFWKLPLDNWEMPNNKGFIHKKLTENKTNKSGCSLLNSTVVLSENPVKGANIFNNFTTPTKTADIISTKGVQMKMTIDSTSFTKVDSLQIIRTRILKK
jgi:hypothetical protein